jgi:hypothetical protein
LGPTDGSTAAAREELLHTAKVVKDMQEKVAALVQILIISEYFNVCSMYFQIISMYVHNISIYVQNISMYFQIMFQKRACCTHGNVR